MFRLTIYDANNWARKQLEAGKSVRDCFEHIKCAPSPTIVVWDGANALKARRRHYPEYKNNRPKLSQDLSAQFRFLEALVPLTHASSVRVDGYEADDVIAHLAENWKVGHCFVYSNDKDLLQLGNVDLYEEVKVPCHRDHIRLYKTLVGDPSDNIKGLPNFGDKSFQKLKAVDLHHLEIWFREGGADNALTEMLSQAAGPAVFKWLAVPGNIELLHTYWDIIGFLEVSERKINLGTQLARNIPEAAEPILQGVLQ